MRKRLALAGSAVGLAGLIAVLTWASAAPAITGPVTLTVIERATTDRVTDVGRAGDSSGDLLTFHNKVYDETNETVLGTDQGTCVRMGPRVGSWECTWTTMLEGGQITVEGPFYDAQDSMVAVTGGTGIYANVRGEMALSCTTEPPECTFVFTLIP